MTNTPAAGDAPHETILVVEDEAELRDMMGDALRLSGYDVVTATDGQHALELLPSIADCCVILLDLLMPRMDGWTFMAKLQADSNFAHIPIIVHSSSTSTAPSNAAKVLQKPVQLDRLLSAVRECCRT
jgi:CheY-like chemotaxis protein